MSEIINPERNSDFSWTIKHFDDQYWFFDDMGFPQGPFTRYDEASDGLDWYSFNWDLRNENDCEI